MKSIYCSLFLLLAPAAAFAQPTITQADMPVPGVSWTGHSDSLGSSAIPIAPPGPAQTWNYTSYFQQVRTNVSHYLDPVMIPGNLAQYYPNAGVALHLPAYGLSVFYKSQSNGFYIDGALSIPNPNDTIVQDYAPDFLSIPLPFTYQDTRSYVSRLVMLNQQAGNKTVFHVNQSYTADAWGSLTLPSGTFPNTLRVKTSNVVTDTSFIFQNGNWVYQGSSTYTEPASYLWLRNSPTNFLLMEGRVNTQNPGFTNPFGTAYYTGTVLSAPAAAPVAQVQPYPNPATALVTIPIEAAGAQRLVITSVTGQEVASEPVSGINQLRYSTSHLPAGVYSYRVTSREGEALQQGRFTVLK